MFFQDCFTVIGGAPSYSKDRAEFSPRVWYSPEIDACKFRLHILSDTLGGFQWLKYILLVFCMATTIGQIKLWRIFKNKN